MKRLQYLAAFLLALLALPGVSSADDLQWNRQKGDCEYVLKAPDRYPLDSVQECTIRWEQYKDVSILSPDERSLFARGFSWLFVYGDGNQKTLAQGALGRVGKNKPLCLVEGTWRDPNIGQSCTDAAQETVEVRQLPTVTPRKPSKGAEAKAKKLNGQGFKAYKKGRYAEAVQSFQDALGQDPFYVKAKYNLACNLSLLGDADGAVQQLLELQSWDSPEARAHFQQARSDRDFERLHNDNRFRRMVGLVRVQLLNGAGEAGLYHVGQLHKKLTGRNFYIAQYGFDRHIRKRPLVYYRKGYEAQAAQVKEMVANVRTASIEIKFDTPFDLIVVWGDPDVAKEEGISGPVVQGTDARDDTNAAENFLNKVNDAKKLGKDVGETATEAPPLPGQ
jgi:tetratricopeptide (TPR) repeat protein